MENLDQEQTCPRHGAYQDPLGCPTCEQEARKAEQRLDLDWRWYGHWLRSGIPARYQSRTLENWSPVGPTQKTAAKTVAGYAAAIKARAKAGDGLTLLGPPGVGKTHLLTALVTVAHQYHLRALYWSWPDLVATVRKSMKSARDDPARFAMDHAADAPLLALDEIGHGTGTEWERLQLFELIDYRYREQLPILTASNATSKTLASLVGERLADRLREVNAPVLIPGESQRANVNPGNVPAMQPPPESIAVRVHAFGEDHDRQIRGNL